MMPAGVYYVGDLCYVMSDEEWDDFCSVTIKDNECLSGEFNMPDGRKFATYGTQWGDGEYLDQKHNRYGVDSGSIGCIKLDDIKTQKYDDISRLGNVVNFQNDFETSTNEDGMIFIGNLHIDTNPEFEYD